MAPAPRTIMSLIAWAVSRKSRVVTSLKVLGNHRCSIRTTTLLAGSKVTVRKCRVRFPTVTFMKRPYSRTPRKSRSNFDLRRANFFPDFGVSRMLAQRREVGVFGEPLEIGIAGIDRLQERCGGALELAGQRIAAGQVVLHQGIIGAQLGQLFINSQALAELLSPGVIITEDLQRLDVMGIAPDHSFDKADFYIQIPLFLSGQLLSLVEVFGHITEKIFPAPPL